MNRKGQALVETAVALTAACLGVVMTAQLVYLCHNAVALQMMAAKTARLVSAEANPGLPVAIQSPLWGRVLPPRRSQATALIQLWRPAVSPSVIHEKGRLCALAWKTTLLAGPGFQDRLPPLAQAASVETLIEPPLPPED